MSKLDRILTSQFVIVLGTILMLAWPAMALWYAAHGSWLAIAAILGLATSYASGRSISNKARALAQMREGTPAPQYPRLTIEKNHQAGPKSDT